MYRGGRGRKGRGSKWVGERHGQHHRNQGASPWREQEDSFGDPSEGRRYSTEKGRDDGGARGGSRGQSRGGRHPPGLSGREIGLWYAARDGKRKQERERQERQSVPLDDRREQNIRRLLHNIQTSESIDPQPARSYQDPDYSEQSAGRSYNEAAQDWNQSGFETPAHIGQSKPWSCSAEEVHKSHGSSQSTSGSRTVPNSWWDDDDHDGDDTKMVVDKIQISLDTGSSTDNRTAKYWNEAEQSGAEGNKKVDGSSEVKDEDIDFDDDVDVDFDDSKVYKYSTEDDFLFFNETADSVCGESFGPTRDSHLDDMIASEYQDKQMRPRYRKMLEFRKRLPSFRMRQSILDVITENQVTVISGETGCGKTTQVAQFILDDFIEKGKASLCHVVCTQPRRISAVSVAERVADERDEVCGNNGSVGYQIRLESKMPRGQSSILYCTTGILLKWLEGDPLLTRATHIVLDEIHERDLLSDFLIIILKDILPRRPDLRLVLMSATLNAEMFSEYFGNSPMLNIPGFTYPVTEFLLEDILEMTSYHPDNSNQPMRRGYRDRGGKQRREEEEEKAGLEDWLYSLNGKYSFSTLEAIMQMDFKRIDLKLIVRLVDHIVMNKEDGAILIFVPGWDEISKLNDQLTRNPKYHEGNCRIIPLHSLMPTVNQKQVFDRPPPGIRKIIIATNIAETSITIDDVVYVIDGGKIKVKNYIPEKNLTTLEPQWVSKANAKQRRGRAGRVQPGECYHLYTGLKEAQLQEYLQPEILRTRLEELCLQIRLLKLGKIEPFISRALEPPSLEALHAAIINLMELNALDVNENLTPLGYHLARMPVDPHVGKMILFGAMFCCLDPVLTVAASLGFKDAFTIPLGKEKEADRKRKELSRDSKSDHILLINAFQDWERMKSRGTDRQFCWDNFLSPNTLKMLANMKKQFADLLHDLGFISSRNPKDRPSNINSGNLGLVKAVLCAGLYPNVAKIAKVPKGARPVTFCTKTDSRVTLHPKSVNSNEKNFESKWFIFHQKLKTNSINLHDCSMVSPYPLLFFGGDIDIRQDHGQDCVAIDDWILFKASPSIAQLVMDLRKELDRLLEVKVSQPGITNWDQNTKEGALMRAIVDLISMEEDMYGNEGGARAGRSDRYW